MKPRWRFSCPTLANPYAVQRCFERIAKATHPSAPMSAVALRALCWRGEIALCDLGHNVFELLRWQVRPLGADVWVAVPLYDNTHAEPLRTVADLLELLQMPTHARTQPSEPVTVRQPRGLH